MARVKLVEPEEADPKARAVFEDIVKTHTRGKVKGRIGNLYKVYANVPELFEVEWSRIKTMMKGLGLPPKLKEAICLSVAVVNICDV